MLASSTYYIIDTFIPSITCSKVTQKWPNINSTLTTLLANRAKVWKMSATF